MHAERPLVLLHGALGTGGTLSPVADLLHDDFKIFCPDFPGHGSRAGTSEVLRMDILAEFLGSYFSEHDLRNPLVFGFSMGGYVALTHAVRHPGVISAIVTLGTKYDWSPEIAQQEAGMLDADLLRRKVPAFADVLAERHGAMQWKSLLQRTAEMMVDLGATPILTVERVRQLHIPVHICRGSEDRMVMESESISMADMLPNGRYIRIEGLLHPIEKAPPAVVADLIRDAFG